MEYAMQKGNHPYYQRGGQAECIITIIELEYSLKY